MKITLSTFALKKYELEVESSDSIEKLREQCEKICGSPCFYLRFAGKRLEDGHTIADYNIQKESTIHQAIPLRGGMYHVSSGLQFQLTIVSARIMAMGLCPEVFQSSTYRSDVSKVISNFLNCHHDLKKLKIDLLNLLFPNTNEYDAKVHEILDKFITNVIKSE